MRWCGTGVRGGECLDGQLVEFNAAFLRLTHQRAHGAVRLAERGALLHEIVGQIGRHHRTRAGGTHACSATY